MHRLIRPLAFVLAAALAPSTQAQAPADSWPAKPLRIIVPANAGGGTADPVSRVLAKGRYRGSCQGIFQDLITIRTLNLRCQQES